MILFSNVLVATDFSETSSAALAHGRALAHAFGANLFVFQVVDEVAAKVGPEYYGPDLSDLQKHGRGSAAAAGRDAVLFHIPADPLITPRARSNSAVLPAATADAHGRECRPGGSPRSADC